MCLCVLCASGELGFLQAASIHAYCFLFPETSRTGPTLDVPDMLLALTWIGKTPSSPDSGIRTHKTLQISNSISHYSGAWAPLDSLWMLYVLSDPFLVLIIFFMKVEQSEYNYLDAFHM